MLKVTVAITARLATMPTKLAGLLMTRGGFHHGLSVSLVSSAR
jgi:hypothetical protein